MAPRSTRPPEAPAVRRRGAPGIVTASSAAATRAPASAVFAFLEDLTNHELITGHELRLDGLSPDGRGAEITIRGPVGIRRTAHTRVNRLEPPSVFGGTAQVGRRTSARVLWRIDDAGAGAHVTLTATVLSAGPLDRLLLRLGGAWLLARGLDDAVRSLAAALDARVPDAPAGESRRGDPVP
jgi:Polyketide cyclase / dehydrase and lipid transport